MGTRREPRAAPPGARDFMVRVASNWRTSPSTDDSAAAAASVNEPLLARTETGWALDTDDEIEASSPRPHSGQRQLRLRFDNDGDLDEKETALSSLDKTRRWLVGCFVVILLAGTGWRIATSGQADLARLKSQWDAGVQKVHDWSAESAQAASAGRDGDSYGSRPADWSDQLEGEGEGAGVGTDGLDSLEDDKAPTGSDSEDESTRPLLENVDSTAAGTAGLESNAVAAATRLNVHPKPRPLDPAKSSQQRYLAFENHSGFHNQRKSLVNALVLAKLLNRTLLLPPARLGNAVPWEPDPKHSLAFSERCKAGLEPDKPVASNAKSHLIGLGEACEPPSGWTYVGWDYLVTPDLLEGHDVIDRWNSSVSWLSAPSVVDGLEIAPQDIHIFEDMHRRSYQIIDSPDTTLDSHFASRLDLDSLRDPAGLGQKRLLQFGSLFSGSRLKLVDPENRALYDQTFRQVVLQTDELDAISSEVRDTLGSYVAIHARLGDGVFKSHAERNMQRLFRTLCVEVFGFSKATATKLWKDSTSSIASDRFRRAPERRNSDTRQSLEEVPLHVDYAMADEVDEDQAVRDRGAAHALHSRDSHARRRRSERASGSSAQLARRAPLRGEPARPLAPYLHCRGQLHEALHLAALNTPLYIATDSHHPLTDPNLAAFFRWFPCTFVLDDFARVGPVNEKPIEALAQLASTSAALDESRTSRWTSDWDGIDLGHFLLPFLEAEIAARAVRVLGTHQSTFSGYTTTVLHDDYVKNGLVAPWSNQ